MGQLYEITPFSLLDYPGEMSCIAWFAGCNMRCVFCHNPKIVESRGDKEDEELLVFLRKRIGKLSAVVFSGGEATLYAGLSNLIRKVRELGFKIKLDTNGSRPEILRDLLEQGLLDYVAMDFKCIPDKAERLIGTGKLWEPFHQSLAMMIEAATHGVAFEVRTTVHPDLMNEDDLNWIIGDLESAGYQGTYYIQNIVSVGENTIGNVAKPEGSIDPLKLKQPQGFKLAFRNF